MLLRLTNLLLFLVGVSLPFEWANIELAGINWTPSKVLNGMLLALALVRVALEPRPRRQDPKLVWFMLFGFAIAVSTAHSYFLGVPGAALLTAVLTWYSLIAFYFLLVFLLRDRRDLDLILYAIVVGSVVVAATGFLGFGYSTYSQEGDRIGGQGGNSNALAMNLVIALPLTLVWLDSARNPISKIALGAAGMFILAAIGATLSRSAFLALPVMAVYWAVRLRVRNVFRYGFPVVCLLIAVALFTPEAVSERFASLAPTNARTDDSIQSRATTNKLGVQAFAESPLIGIGSLRFFSYAIEHGAPFVNVIHHAYLDVAVEEGLLGLIPFLAITVISWRDFTRAARAMHRNRARGDETRALETRAVLLHAAFIGTLVICQFQPMQHSKGLWLLFALSTSVSRLAQGQSAVANAAPAATLSYSGRHPRLGHG